MEDGRYVFLPDDVGHQGIGITASLPFDEDSMVTLSGEFLDRLSLSVKTIRKALKDADPAAQRNGEGLISFMQSIME